MYTGKPKTAWKGRWQTMSEPFCSVLLPAGPGGMSLWCVFIKLFWTQLSVETYTYDPCISEDETGGWPGVQGHPSYNPVPVQPGWQSETLAPHQKNSSAHAKFSMCIHSVHCEPDAFLPRWLHATHWLFPPWNMNWEAFHADTNRSVPSPLRAT